MSTPNMGLTAPSVGITPGPTYAQNINADLTTIDQHDHSSGKGVQITPSGLNISSDLLFQGNNATLLRSIRFSPQLSPLALGSDIGCLYESGVDLYYNDGNGNQIRITQSGSIAGASGNISGLVSPASATFVPLSGTFIWQSDSAKAASMDMGPLLLRNVLMSSDAITFQAPTTSFTGYTITLPAAAPGSTLPISMDSSGNLSTVPISTAGIADMAVTDAKIAGATLTLDKNASFITYSNVLSGTYTNAGTTSGSTSSTSFTKMFDVTLTTTIANRPLILNIMPHSNTLSPAEAFYEASTSSGAVRAFNFQLEIVLYSDNGATAVADWLHVGEGPIEFGINMRFPIPLNCFYVDTTTTLGGSKNYTVYARFKLISDGGSIAPVTHTFTAANYQLMTYQI